MGPRPTPFDATLSGVIFHEEDFLFANRKEELAHRIRAALRSSLSDTLGPPAPRMGVDKDGDIRITGRAGKLYVGRTTTFFIASEAPISEAAHAAAVRLAGITNRLFALRRGLIASGYGFRISVDLRYDRDNAAELLKASLLAAPSRAASLLRSEDKLLSMELKMGVTQGTRHVWREYETLSDHLEFSYGVREEPGSRTFEEFVTGLRLKEILDAEVTPALGGLVPDPKSDVPPPDS